MTKEPSPRVLIDANVLIAVLDQQHEHHTAAIDWFIALGDGAAVTCPTVENACLRYLLRTGVAAADALLATFDGGLHQMRPRRTLRVPTAPSS